jgi:hypothetical protein
MDGEETIETVDEAIALLDSRIERLRQRPRPRLSRGARCVVAAFVVFGCFIAPIQISSLSHGNGLRSPTDADVVAVFKEIGQVLVGRLPGKRG